MSNKIKLFLKKIDRKQKKLYDKFKENRFYLVFTLNNNVKCLIDKARNDYSEDANNNLMCNRLNLLDYPDN